MSLQQVRWHAPVFSVWSSLLNPSKRGDGMSDRESPPLVIARWHHVPAPAPAQAVVETGDKVVELFWQALRRDDVSECKRLYTHFSEEARYDREFVYEAIGTDALFICEWLLFENSATLGAWDENDMDAFFDFAVQMHSDEIIDMFAKRHGLSGAQIMRVVQEGVQNDNETMTRWAKRLFVPLSQ